MRILKVKTKFISLQWKFINLLEVIEGHLHLGLFHSGLTCFTKSCIDDDEDSRMFTYIDVIINILK